jgi:hypothetical protein
MGLSVVEDDEAIYDPVFREGKGKTDHLQTTEPSGVVFRERARELGSRVSTAP